MFSAAAVVVFLVLIINYSNQVNAQANTIMNDQEKTGPISTGSTYWLNELERSQLADKADLGDKDAAFRLAQYYAFLELDSEKERHWLERAARAGHIVAQHNLSFLLYFKEDPDIHSALFWAETAKNNGDTKAQALIDEIRATVR